MISVLQIRQGEKFKCLGEDQYFYMEKQEGDEMPQAVEFDDDDCDTVTQMKQLILEMTSYAAKDRPLAALIVKKTTFCYVRAHFYTDKANERPPPPK